MKRIISALLVMVLCLGMLPAAAFAAENPFTDVAPGKYYYEPVLWAVEKGITTGTTTTTFSPDDPCTRKQIVTFLWRYMGQPEPKSMENPFTDVKADRFQKAILWAYYEQITTGKTATTFAPDDPCTRKQIVTFLWRAKGQPEPKSMENPFTDVKADRFQKAILWAYYAGITTGKTATTFQPDATCTRAQIVTFLYRSMKDAQPETPTEPTKPAETEPTKPAETEPTKPAETEPTAPPTSPTQPVDELVFTTQPKDVELKVGEKATFSVAVDGGMEPVAYQWQYKLDGGQFTNFTKNENAWATGWNTAELTVEVEQNDFDKHFTVRCVVTDVRDTAITSETATISKYDPLEIVTQPAEVNYIEDYDNLVLSTEVKGGKGPYTYEWYFYVPGFEFRNDVTDSSPTMGHVTVTSEGSKSTMTLFITETMLDKDITFYCRITDANGDYIDTKGATAKNVTPFTITYQPEGEIVDGSRYPYSGMSAIVFMPSIALDGGIEPYTYQWQFREKGSDGEWTNYEVDERSPQIGILAITPAQAYKHQEIRCVVTDALGTQLTSKTVVVGLKELSIKTQPVDTQYKDEFSLTVEAQGGYHAFDADDYTYQWEYKTSENGAWHVYPHGVPGTNVTKELKFHFYVGVKGYFFRCKITDSLGNVVYSDAAQILE